MKLFGRITSTFRDVRFASHTSSGLAMALVFVTAVISNGAKALPQANTLTVIVAPFSNTDKLHTGGNTLAKWATDSVAVELASTDRFEVLKQIEVDRQAKELGYRAPYDKVELMKIATNLGATAIVSGEVSFVRPRTSKGALDSVEVGVQVRMVDASSGELINGGAEIGIAKFKVDQTDIDTLSRNAVGKAVMSNVREILNFTLPEGIVTLTSTNTSETHVLINRGAREGVQEGMEMLILRNGQSVGHIRITAVYASDAEAVVLDTTQGIRPMDKIRATFPMPSFAISR